MLETFAVAAVGGVFGALAAQLCWSGIDRAMYVATREWALQRAVRTYKRAAAKEAAADPAHPQAPG